VSKLEVREATPQDRSLITRVVETAFGRPAEADLVERLIDDRDAVLSLVASDGGEIIGHILFSRMGAPFPALALAPLAVAPERQRRGVGAAFIRRGLALAEERGWAAVFSSGTQPTMAGSASSRSWRAAFCLPMPVPT
jgi:putative acetyltransferase